MRSEIITLQQMINRDSPISVGYPHNQLIYALVENDRYAYRQTSTEMYGNFSVCLTVVAGGESIVKVRQTMSYEERPGHWLVSHDNAFAVTSENLKIVSLVKAKWTRPENLTIPTGLQFVFDQPTTVRKHLEWPFTLDSSIVRQFDADLSEMTVWFSSESVARYAASCFESWLQTVPSAATAAPTQLSDFDPPTFGEFPTVRPGGISRS